MVWFFAWLCVATAVAVKQDPLRRTGMKTRGLARSSGGKFSVNVEPHGRRLVGRAAFSRAWDNWRIRREISPVFSPKPRAACATFARE
jgi:hypothetical protein